MRSAVKFSPRLPSQITPLRPELVVVITKDVKLLVARISYDKKISGSCN